MAVTKIPGTLSSPGFSFECKLPCNQPAGDTPVARFACRRIAAAARTKSPVLIRGRAFRLNDGVAVTYFRVRDAHYHWRKLVSQSCSGWEGVVPSCCGRHIEEE